MGMESYASSKFNLTLARLRVDLEEINTRRFKGILTITVGGMEADEGFLIVYPDHAVMSVWLASKRRAAMRGGGTPDFGWYVRFVFQEELAKKYSGRCSTDNLAETWPPEPEMYPTWESYFFRYYDEKGYQRDPEQEKFFHKGYPAIFQTV